MRDPYEIVGVERGVSYAEARRVYMRRVRLLHPDRVAGDADLAAEATRLTAELTRAWEAVKTELEPGSRNPTGTTTEPSARKQERGASAGQTRGFSDRADSRSRQAGSAETTDDILDWMVGALLEQVQLERSRLTREELMMLYMSATELVANHTRKLRKLYQPALLLLDAVIESDLATSAESVKAPSEVDVPKEWWWDSYVRLDELGNESLMLFLLDDILDPSPKHWLR